jgi:hypothetical protein
MPVDLGDGIAEVKRAGPELHVHTGLDKPKAHEPCQTVAVDE